MSGDLLALSLGLVAVAVAASWPVLPGLRRLSGFKTFPPFRDWEARPHPDAIVEVQAGRRIDLTPDRTDATVIVRTAWRNQDSRDVTPSLKMSRPVIPLVSVDGHPAAWGWGTVKLTLTPGQHLIAVTSSHSRCYRTVILDRGDRTELDYTSVIGATAHRYREAGSEIRDLTAFEPRRRERGPGAHLAIAASGTAIIAGFAALAIASTPAASTLIGSAVWGSAGLGLSIGIAVIATSTVRQMRGSRRIVAVPPQTTDEWVPRILDADAPQRLDPALGWAALGLHLRFELEPYAPAALAALASTTRSYLWQRWRAIRIGEPAPPVCRPWIPPPLVLLDGKEVPAGWTRMWMQVPPGEHEIVVRVGAPPSQVDDRTILDFGQAEIRRRFTTTAGTTTGFAFTADITAVPAPDRPRLAEYRPRLR